eukprot:548014_1
MGNSSKKEKEFKQEKVITCWNDDNIERHTFVTFNRSEMGNTSGKRYFDMKCVYNQATNTILIATRMIKTNAIRMCEWRICTCYKFFNYDMNEFKIIPSGYFDTDEKLYDT